MHTRRFIAGPVLASVVEMLTQRVRDGAWDLSRLIIVTPGSRAGRVLVSMLADRASELSVALGPPLTITPSELAGSILLMLEGAHGAVDGGWREKPPASALVKRAMWIRSLRQQSVQTLREIAALDPAPDDARAWNALASVLERSADDLASAGFRMRDAAARCAELADFTGQQRLIASARVQDAYEALLSTHGISDPAIAAIDAVHAWRARLSEPGSANTTGDAGVAGHADPTAADVYVLLVGVVELGRVARDACHLPGVHTTAIIAGTESWQDRFDDLGCLNNTPSTRENAPTISAADLADEAHVTWPAADEVWIADTPRDQALKALSALALASQDAAVPPHDVLIGVPDASVAFHLEREARRVGTRVRAGLLFHVSHTEAFRTCTALLDHARERTLASMRALLLRPRVEAWVTAHVRSQINESTPASVRATLGRGLLDAVDTYADRAVHASLDIAFHTPQPNTRWILDATRDTLDALSQPIARATTGASAAMALLHALAKIYRDASLDTAESPGYRREAAAAQAIAQGLREAATAMADPFAAPSHIGRHAPSSQPLSQPTSQPTSQPAPITAAPDAISTLLLALTAIGDAPLAEDPEPDAIEGLGWLEILLDPAPLVILTGMNAGVVPSRTTPDPLVPEALRRIMGMEHAGTRGARDAMLFAAMLACKSRVISILGRHDDEGAALLPSPVLLPNGTDALATLLERFARETPGDTPSQCICAIRPKGRTRTAAHKPLRMPWVDAPLPSHLSVTSLRDYLRSPYVFYLRHILDASEVDAPATVLDPSTMGSLLHRTLEALAHHAVDATDPRTIESILMDELSAQVSRSVAISHETRGTAGTLLRLQVESVRQRLRAAANAQAQLRQEGWRIFASEVSLSGGLVVANDPNLPPYPILRGKIDRIDINDEGHIRVIDYKTGDAPKTPREMHLRSGTWVDLQLPLYRHMAKAAVDGRPFATLHEDTGEPPIELAYFNICANADDIGICPAEWDADDLAHADSVAQGVLRAIVQRQFDDVGDGIEQSGATGALAAWAAAVQALVQVSVQASGQTSGNAPGSAGGAQ